MKRRVMTSGLYPLTLICYQTINRTLISTFVERWYPETNTIHLPFGEMTITLEDVQQLIHILVVGIAVIVSAMMFEELVDICLRNLGIDEDEIIKELTCEECKHKSVRLEWLRKKLSGVARNASQETTDFSARGYLLYLLGRTIFANKSGRLVLVEFLALLDNFENVNAYAWGAAALAFLYRQLGIASRSETRQIARYITLVEAWWYEHFPFERPLLTQTMIG